MMKNKKPVIRFKGFSEEWGIQNWEETVDMSTNMVDPKSGTFDDLFHIGPGNIESFTGQTYNNILRVKDSNLISGKFYFKKGDIIYGKINPQLAKYIIAPYEGLASADAYVLNSKNSLVQEFLFMILQTKNFFEYSVSVSARTGMPKINRDELNVFNYLAPKLQEQTQIGNFFKNLDNLITLHQRKYEKLGVLKKAMLEKMFPKSGANVPEIRFKGFTGAWEERKLSQIIDLRSGRDYKHLSGGNIPVYGTGGYMLSVNEALSYDEDAIGIGRKGTIDKPYILKAPFWTVDTLFYAVPLENNNLDFIYAIFQKINWKKRNEATGVPSLSKVAINAIQVVIPQREEQEKIGTYFKNLDDLLRLHDKELEKLKNLKKALLEKMFV